MKKLLLLGFALSSAPALAASAPSLYNLNASQAEEIVESFGAAQMFRAVEPPSSYGRLFGLSFGVVGTYGSAGKLNDATPAPIQDLDFVPSADLFLGVQGPLGLALELGGVPRTTVQDFRIQKIAANVKWTITDLFFGDVLPVEAALRAGYGRNTFDYRQTVTVSGSPVSDTVEFDSRVLQTQLAVSYQVLVFEPFLGLGWARQSSTLSNSVATVDLFNFTNAQSFEVGKGSFWLNAGFEMRLLAFTLGAQYDRLFGNSSVSAKLGFKF